MDIKLLHDKLLSQLGVDVRVVLGGSNALGEAGEYSDRDIYLVVRRLRDIFTLLKYKQDVIAIKKEFDCNDVLILKTEKWFQKWYYAYGFDHEGKLCAPTCDYTFLRINCLKRGYRELCLARFDTPEKKKYHLRKALVQALYADAFFQKHIVLCSHPLFSIQKVIDHIERIDFIADKKYVCDILELKIDDEDYVAHYLEKVFNKQKKKLFSWRSWVISTVFALKQDFRGNMSLYYDKKIIDTLVLAYDKKDNALFETVSKKINYILCI